MSRELVRYLFSIAALWFLVTVLFNYACTAIGERILEDNRRIRIERLEKKWAEEAESRGEE